MCNEETLNSVLHNVIYTVSYSELENIVIKGLLIKSINAEESMSDDLKQFYSLAQKRYKELNIERNNQCTQN